MLSPENCLMCKIAIRAIQYWTIVPSTHLPPNDSLLAENRRKVRNKPNATSIIAIRMNRLARKSPHTQKKQKSRSTHYQRSFGLSSRGFRYSLKKQNTQIRVMIWFMLKWKEKATRTHTRARVRTRTNCMCTRSEVWNWKFWITNTRNRTPRICARERLRGWGLKRSREQRRELKGT